jgi:MFS family permease
MFCGQPAVVLFPFGILAPAISSATSWSRVALAVAIGPAVMMGALLAPITGRLADRFGPRRVALVGGPAFAIGLAAIGLFAHSSSQFAILLAIACALGFAATPVIYVQLVSGWFDKRRGLALSLMFAASSLGAAAWPAIIAVLLTKIGWRSTYLVMGASVGVLVTAAALILIRNVPRRVMQGATAAVGLSMKETAATSRFWKLLTTFMLANAVFAGTSVNLPIIVKQSGASLSTAAATVSTVGISMFLGRILVGALLDRLRPTLVTAVFLLLPLPGYGLACLLHSSVSFFVLAALVGLGLGAEINAAAFIASRAFGLKAFGEIYGATTLGYGLATAVGPASIGALLAMGGRTDLVFIGCGAALFVAALLLFTIRREDLPYA